MNRLITLLLFCLSLNTAYSGNNDSIEYAGITSILNASETMYVISHSLESANAEEYVMNDFTIEYDLANLNEKTPIELYFDKDVGRWVNFYVRKKPELTKKIVELSKFYFPLFEKELDKYQLPLELKYIPVIESSLNPNARSRSGAVGLWQFLYETGRLMNLKITTFVDERKDPYKSTEAACNYFRYLYSVFDDWLLAIAAYNCGATTVKNAIQRAGGKKDFYSIRKYLPQEARQYVPKFIAASYFMTYYDKLGIKPEKDVISFFKTDTVLISEAVRFDAVSKYTGVPLEIIKFLNPQYSKNYKPKTPQKERIVLPTNAISRFIEHKNDILIASANKNIPVKKNKKKIIHTVKKGEYLHLLEVKYKVPADSIRNWNNLKSDILHSNQKLIIWVDEDVWHMLNK